MKNNQDIKYRLSIFRSSRNLFAQIIAESKTLLGLSDKKMFSESKEKKTKIERAKEFGIFFGKEAVKKGIKKIVFDRGNYHYHGRVKAFADGAREGGLQF